MASVSQQPDRQLERVLETVFAARKYRSVLPGLARANRRS